MSDEIKLLFIGTLALFTFIGYMIGSAEQNGKEVTLDLTKLPTERLVRISDMIADVLKSRGCDETDGKNEDLCKSR